MNHLFFRRLSCGHSKHVEFSQESLNIVYDILMSVMCANQCPFSLYSGASTVAIDNKIEQAMVGPFIKVSLLVLAYIIHGILNHLYRFQFTKQHWKILTTKQLLSFIGI